MLYSASIRVAQSLVKTTAKGNTVISGKASKLVVATAFNAMCDLITASFDGASSSSTTELRSKFVDALVPCFESSEGELSIRKACEILANILPMRLVSFSAAKSEFKCLKFGAFKTIVLNPQLLNVNLSALDYQDLSKLVDKKAKKAMSPEEAEAKKQKDLQKGLKLMAEAMGMDPADLMAKLEKEAA